MQLDMHYYGTYAMARASGLTPEACRIIATASQFVDDNAQRNCVEFRDAGSIDSEATAHHVLDLRNIDRRDQRQIWVPFHFLPGNEGDGFTERLICRKGSAVVKDMVAHNIGLHTAEYYLELVGITAHVYADTFSHFGFSGVSSRKNKVMNDSFHFYELVPQIEEYIKEKEKRFRESYHAECGFLGNIKSWLAETTSGALGHGAVATFPDRPYLIWDFVYEEDATPSPLRNNPETFMEACEALYTMFVEVGERVPHYCESEKRREFSSIREKVNELITFQGKKEERIEAWKNAALDDSLFGDAEQIPVYEDWNNAFRALDGQGDSQVARSANIYRFYQAASLHRQHVLRHLLPMYDLIVA